MLAEDFIARKRPHWDQFSRLLDRAGAGLAALSADDLQALGRLYRQAASDLAVARRDFPQHPVCAYLNALVARGHGTIYRSRSVRLRELGAFFTRTFPQIFRATWPYTLAAFLMFLVPALVGFAIGWRNPDDLALLLPGIESVIADVRAGREWWQDINTDGRTASASLIMTNNIRVTFMAFAGGVLLGGYTLYILALNGMLIGGISGVAQRFDFAANLWGFVAAHGVIELSVIFIAGGAGLQLGWALLRPGLLSRRAALVVAARRAGQLLLGCVPLLVVAGVIEGFISPAPIPLAAKLFVACGSGLLLYTYLLHAGRPRP